MVEAAGYDTSIASHTRVLADNLAKLYVAPDMLGRAVRRQNEVLKLAEESASIKNGQLPKADLKELARIAKQQKGLNKRIADIEREIDKATRRGNKSEVKVLREEREAFVKDRNENASKVKQIHESSKERGEIAAATLKERIHTLNAENNVTSSMLRAIDPYLGSMAVDYIAETDRIAKDSEAASSFASAGIGGIGARPGLVGSLYQMAV